MLMEGVRIARKVVMETKAFQGKVKQFLIWPGEDRFPLNSDEELLDFIRKHSFTLYHPVGTCKMGPDNDPLAVVDSSCRVRGIKNLRVVDASIMPTVRTSTFVKILLC